MRKDNSKVSEYAKHTRNAGGYGRRGVNKRVRLNTKAEIRKEAEESQEDGVKTIKLPCFDIVLELIPDGNGDNGGSIKSKLKLRGDGDHNHRIDGLESLILSCACEGIDVASPAFLAAIETSVEAIANAF